MDWTCCRCGKIYNAFEIWHYYREKSDYLDCIKKFGSKTFNVLED